MQLYAGFAFVVIAIIAIIVLAAIVSNLIGRAAAPIREGWSIPFGHPNRVRRIRALRADAAI